MIDAKIITSPAVPFNEPVDKKCSGNSVFIFDVNELSMEIYEAHRAKVLFYVSIEGNKLMVWHDGEKIFEKEIK